MTQHGTDNLIQLLRENRDTLAHDAVARQYARHGIQWETYGAPGREKSVRDMGYHLDYLVEALAVADPSLFNEYIAWVKILFSNLGFPETVIMETLACLREALLSQFSGAIAALALVYLDAGRETAIAAPTTLQSFLAPDALHFQLARTYLERLLAGERQQASALVMDAVRRGVSIRDLYIHVFQVGQREIGRLWQVNEISVAQEHYCTAATQLIMSQLYSHIFGMPRNGRQFVGTCVGGELHELGVRMVADFLEMDGWDTYYLGANTPLEAVVRTVKERPVDVVGISVTMTFHVRKAADLIARLRSMEGTRPKILVGGYPFNISTDLWRAIGADGCAPDAQAAVELANELVTER